MHDTILTMIPGPTPVHPRILADLGLPTVSHVAPGFVERFRACLGNLGPIVRTESARPFLVGGAGTLGMEMALANLLTREDRLLVLSQGFFGDRWGQLAEAFGIECDLVQSAWGRAVGPEELERRLAGGHYAAVALTHVDTSTGTAAPVETYCDLLRGREELVILDGVCATAGMDERFDEWGIDVLLTGAQKALGAPPGLAILLASERALERRRSLGRVPAYYADWLRWLPVMEDPSRYFSTPPVNEILALHAATEMVLEEGLEARFARHRGIARAVRAGLDALGLETFTDGSCRADTLTVACLPDGLDDGAFRDEMVGRKVVVAAALGPIAGKAFRIGHMGNIGHGEVVRLLHALEGSLAALGRPIEAGTALAAAAPHLS